MDISTDIASVRTLCARAERAYRNKWVNTLPVFPMFWNAQMLQSTSSLTYVSFMDVYSHGHFVYFPRITDSSECLIHPNALCLFAVLLLLLWWIPKYWSFKDRI